MLLDEIGEMKLDMQVKLLRVLQEREVERVGGTKPIKLNVRILSATNKDLKKAVAEGKFRQDLYYRLNVIEVETQPLREHREDIPVLAEYFVTHYAAEMNRNVHGISAAAQRILENYDWPGNVRELQNVIERAVAVATTDVLLPDNLVSDLRQGKKREEGNFNLKERRDAIDRDTLEIALIREGGKCQQVAKTVGLNTGTVYKMIKKFNLSHLLQQPRN